MAKEDIEREIAKVHLIGDYAYAAAKKAMAIVVQIDNDKFTDEEKATAIYLVMNAPTRNFVTKEIMLNVIKWLWHKNYEWFIPEDKLKEGAEE